MTGSQSSVGYSLMHSRREIVSGKDEQETYSVLDSTYSKAKDDNNGEAANGYSKLNF